ncbi:MAG: DHH family phosphoesterase [Candidatus Promineifilaceae bacterium]|nr:DHH family phosphoesterase [Candidatus Promineifilaceae bacterium]
MTNSTVQAAEAALRQADCILVITHVSPDGDALSSLSAMGLALRQLDKRYSLVCDDGLPSRFQFLPLAKEIENGPDGALAYDLIVSLDAGDIDRLGQAYRSLSHPRPPILNIDHHATNTEFGQINLVDGGANSTTEVLYRLFGSLGLQIDPQVATSLLTGLVTDTLCFRTAAVDADTLRVGADLVDAGADLFEVTNKGLNLKARSTLELWRTGLDNMRLEEGVLWTSISRAERQLAGHPGRSSMGLSNLLSDVYEAAMAAVLIEQDDGRVSVGFRCRPPYSVSELAEELGGGGHHLAAGCTVEGPLAKAESLVVARSKAAIRRQRASLVEERDDATG